VRVVTRLFVVIAILAAMAAGSSAGAAREAARCRGAQLAGSFAAVRDSAGAGNINYTLKLKNTSASTCTVTGLPAGRLLGLHKGSLPTHVRAAFPGALTAVLVTLAPGRSARATARFSPDVPGTGEQMTGRCEPVAYWLRVTGQGGGTTTVKIAPPTSVCEHGRLSFSAYSLG
jgi:Protein of unknown function (DUF4232)